jgi:hypothetical protein
MSSRRGFPPSRHSAREWRNPGHKDVIGMAIPGFWIPAIHAGMTSWRAMSSTRDGSSRGGASACWSMAGRGRDQVGIYTAGRGEDPSEVAMAQVLSYLRATGLHRALPIDFARPRLVDGVKRLSL